MTTSPFEVVQQAYEHIARGDLPAWIDMWTEDVEFRQTGAVPWGGTCSGKEACLGFLQRAGEYIESVAAPDEPLYRAGDEVIAIGRSRGIGKKTGRRFDVRVVHVWRVRDERIAGWALFVDTETLLPAIVPDRTTTPEN
jgi:ketosteroid isomerase-like protein